LGIIPLAHKLMAVQKPPLLPGVSIGEPSCLC
ncbi:hypothetical protein LCGC14_2177160, partial [marine sediment metagenome]